MRPRRLTFDIYRGILVVALFLWRFLVPLAVRLIGRNVDPREIGVLLRGALERMGVTYNKVGQYLAIRFDILPTEVCQELGALFENTAPLPPKVVRAALERELGGSLIAVFKWFDDQPLGAASIAQVHRAETLDGAQVVVKVQRPGIRETFDADMRNLSRLAWMADRLGVLGHISLVDLVQEFAEFTRREMNFLEEAATASRMRLSGSPYAYIPEIYMSLCTPSVLVMEFIEGVSLLRICELAESGQSAEISRLLPGVNLGDAVGRLAKACLLQLFVTGVFHGDPHPGNILLRRDGQVVFIDFGIFGELTPYERGLSASYIENLALGNLEAAFRSFSRLTSPSADTDMRSYRREMIQVLRRWREASGNPDLSAQEKHTGRYMNEIITVMRKHDVRLRRNQLLFWRVLIILDATALRVPVNFDLLAAMRSFFVDIRPHLIKRLISDGLDPRGVTDVFVQSLRACASSARCAVGAESLVAYRTLDVGHDRPGQLRTVVVSLVVLAGAFIIPTLRHADAYVGLTILLVIGIAVTAVALAL